MTTKNAAVITFAMQKGGATKTTTTVAFAQYLAMAGNDVLVIDSDPQGNATRALCGQPHNGFALDDVVIGGKPAVEVIIPSKTARLDVLPSNAKCGILERHYQLAEDSNVLLQDMIEDHLLRARYDYILIDTPPSIILTTQNALIASDYVIIPMTPVLFAADGLKETRASIERLQAKPYAHMHLLGIFLAQVDQRQIADSTCVEATRGVAGDLLFKTFIRKSVKVEEALRLNTPIFLYTQEGVGSDFIKLFEEILERIAMVSAPASEVTA